MKMHHFFWGSLFLLFLLLLPFCCAGQEIIHEVYPSHEIFEKHNFQVNLENDLFAGIRINDDRNYTMGLSLAYSDPRMSNWRLFNFQKNLLLHLWSFGNEKSVEVGRSRLEDLSPSLTLSNKSFTPENLAAIQPVRTDRPYGNATMLSSFVRLYDPQKVRVHKLGFYVGLLGSPISKWVQVGFHEIHRFVYPPSQVAVPRGWDNQVSHPGEPSLQLYYGRERYWYRSPWEINRKRVFVDLRESLDVYAGYQTAVSYAITGRWGWRGGPGDKRCWFVYGRLRPQLVLYDGLLQGQFLPSVYRLTYNEVNPLLVDGAGGLGVSWDCKAGRLYTAYGWYWRSAEANFEDAPNFHYWGRLQVVYQW